MSKYNSLGGLFTAIANAIRAKTGGTDPIVAEDFPAAVEGISAGGGDDDVLKLKDFSYFFADGVHQEYVGKIDTSEATKFNGMFYYFSQYPSNTKWVATKIPELDTRNGLDFSAMFTNNTDSTAFPKMNTSKGTNFKYMFSRCSALVKLEDGVVDTRSGENFEGMFNNCTKLTTIPSLDVGNGISFNKMFSGCKALQSIPLLNPSSGTTFSEMFAQCSKLTGIPDMDVSNGTNFYYMFNGCSALTGPIRLNTSKGVDLQSMFSACSNLHTVEIDLASAQNYLTNLFFNCTNLKNLTLYNIRLSLQIGSGTSWGHLLTVDSLVHTIKELCTVTSSKTLTMGSANLEKIAGLYCKITDDTNEKKTMELCESTDEGAMTLADYAAEKGWSFA